MKCFQELYWIDHQISMIQIEHSARAATLQLNHEEANLFLPLREAVCN